MSAAYTLLVTDTSPLITLALAGKLDLLLAPEIPVKIPDAVYVEATRVSIASGAAEIVEWVKGRLDRVAIVPTEIGVDQLHRLEQHRPIRGMGEGAAIEALDLFLAQDPTSRAILLFEDADLRKRKAVIDERVDLITTGQFLRALEQAGLIQSADHILDLAAERGRNVDRQRAPDDDENATGLLSAQLGRGAGTER